MLAVEVLHKRLALVRYLYETALQQSRQTGFRRATAILTFHDAVEMFLTLGLQHHDVYKGTRQYQFADYWSELAKVDVHVTQTSTMESLSRVRASLKHHATIPPDDALEEARVHVRGFFTENGPIVFSLNLEDISLASSVTLFERTREYLESASRLMAEQKYDEGIGQIAFAFAALIEDYDQRFFNESEGYSYIRRVSGGLLHVGQDVRRLADDVQRAFDAIYSTVKIVTLGLDFHSYARFATLSPFVVKLGDGQYKRSEWHRETPPTLDDCRFCFDFIIDSALRLQESVYRE